MTSKLIYLDHAATSPLAPEALETMTQVLSQVHGNPSSLHGLGREAARVLRTNRQVLADLLQTSPNRLIFTSGGTEGNNLAIKGYALANQDKGKHLISSQMEHHAVLDVLAYLENRFGFEVTLLPPSEDGTITAQQVAEALRPDTILVSLMLANNETGHLNPIREIGMVLADHQAAFHVDAVQAVGKLPVLPEELGVDFLSASAHKFHGPKGVGFLYAKEVTFDKLLHGGNQENKRRASTENLAGIAGMVTALKLAVESIDEKLSYVSSLREDFLAAIQDLPIELNSPSDGLPHVLNLSIAGQDNALLLTRFDLEGFALSSGSACTAGNIEPSHVLAALFGSDSPKLKSAIRVSLSSTTKQEDLTALTQTLRKIVG